MKHDGNTEMENGDRAEKKSRVRQSERHGDSDGHLNLRRSDRIRKRNARDNNTEDRDFRNNKIRVSEERKKKGTKFEDEVKNEEDSDDNIRGVHEANGEEEHTDDTHASASFQDITYFQNNEGTSALRSPSSTSIHGLPTEAELMTVTAEQLEEMKGRIESLHNKLDMLEAKERSLTTKIAELEQITLLHGETIRYILQHLQIQPFVLPPRPPPSAEDTDDHSYDTGSQSSDTMSS